MLRYIWKQTFDDRTFSAALLSLVSKGVVSITPGNDGTTHVRSNFQEPTPFLAKEESILLKRLRPSRKGATVSINMLDADTVRAAAEMAEALQKLAGTRWFRQNRHYVIGGSIFSLVPVILSAKPGQPEHMLALASGLAAMAPAGFYLYFILLRMRDLYRAARVSLRNIMPHRLAVLFTLLVSCICAFVLGTTVICGAFGWPTFALLVAMLALDVTFLHLMRAPTWEGQTLIDEIEGFREFLNSVERFPMNRPDGPQQIQGTYERYLPYAVALEVEQAWSDRFVALASTYDVSLLTEHAHSYYLGMYEGKPIEVIFGPPQGHSGRY